MARRRSFLTLLSAAAGLLAPSAIADPTSPDRPQGERPHPPGADSPKRFFHPGGPEADAVRERAIHELQKLSPEKRADLWKAVWTVMNLPPEKRQMLLGMEDERRKFAREEIDRAMSDSGLQLDEEKRQHFVRRYFEERRAIEEKLRKESEEKRRQLIGEMRAKLKQEFESAGVKTEPTAPADGTK